MIRLMLFALLALAIFSFVYGGENAKTNKATPDKLSSKMAAKAAIIKASSVQ